MSQKNVRHQLDLLLSVSHLHRNLMERKVAELGIPGGQYMILRHLAACEEKTKQKDLAAYFEVTAAAIANSLKRMENNGLVKRRSSEIDSRCNHIDITETGRDKLEAADAAFASIDGSLLAGFTDEELATFGAVLEQLQSRLRSMGAREESE